MGLLGVVGVVVVAWGSLCYYDTRETGGCRWGWGVCETQGERVVVGWGGQVVRIKSQTPRGHPNTSCTLRWPRLGPKPIYVYVLAERQLGVPHPPPQALVRRRVVGHVLQEPAQRGGVGPKLCFFRYEGMIVCV